MDNEHKRIVHFASVTWEQHRIDGFLRLKRDAVPTFFIQSASAQDRRSQPSSTTEARESPTTSNGTQNEICEQNGTEDSGTDASSKASSSDSKKELVEKEFVIQQQHFINKKEVDHTDCAQQAQNMLKYYNKSERLRQKTKTKLTQAKKEIKRLRKQIQTAS